MLKKLAALMLALLIPAAAGAEVYQGVTEALSALPVIASASGRVEALEAEAGQRVEAGQALVTLGAEKTFAAEDGVVALLEGELGADVDGTVLTLSPLERYTLYCTVDKAYQSADATLVHSGETLYVRCTADGTHRATGVVTEIDGEEYRVLTLGGELYVGETVWLYRDAECNADQRVGIATVVSSDARDYSASGRLTRLCVDAGDAVERGQLLFEIGGGSVEAVADGILSELRVAPGDAVEENQLIGSLVPEGQVCVAIELDEAQAAAVAPGQRAELIPAQADGEEAVGGEVIDVSRVAEDGVYIARILPDDGVSLPLGMTVEVRL